MTKDELDLAAYHQLKQHHLTCLRTFLAQDPQQRHGTVSMGENALLRYAEACVDEIQHSINIVNICNKELAKLQASKQ